MFSFVKQANKEQDCFLWMDDMASTVLITGASQGIGKVTALLFARKGYDLVLAARQTDLLDALAQEVRSLGRAALVVPTDLTSSPP